MRAQLAMMVRKLEELAGGAKPKPGAKPFSSRKKHKKSVSFAQPQADDSQQADPLWVSVTKFTDAAKECYTPPSDAEVRKQLLALLGPSSGRGRSQRRRSGSASSGDGSPATRGPARSTTAARPAMSDDARGSRPAARPATAEVSP